MEQPIRGLIKKDVVKTGEPRRVGDGQDTADRQGSARIIQQGEGYAIVEVLCPCGRSTRLRCNYPAGADQTI